MCPIAASAEHTYTGQNGDYTPCIEHNGINGVSQSKHNITPRARRIVGQHEARMLAGSHMVDNCEKLEVMNPALGRSVLENGFGSNTPSCGMGYRDWALLTIGVLTAMGDCPDQVGVYTEAAQLHGATEAEILTIINHAASFVGNPRAVNSMRRVHDRLLAARTSESPSQYVVQLNDHDTLIRDTLPPGKLSNPNVNASSSTPLILIHALSMDGYMFNELLPKLGSAYDRVITYDLRGHGYARGAPLVRSLEHLADDLLLLLDTLGIPQADICGASYGGAVAQTFALAHPARVRSLALIATSSTGHPMLHSRATRAEDGEMKQLQIEAIMRWFAPATIAENTWCVRYARQKVERVMISEWSAAWKAMARLDVLHRIPELTMPLLVLCGKQDLSSTPERMRPTFENAKEGIATWVELDPGTHMMVMEMPGPVAETLIKFRRKVDAISS